MARAKKSSKLEGKARKPICWSSWARLFVGTLAVAGEFIVSLQIVRSDIDGLRLGMTAKIHPRRGGGWALVLPKQKGNRRSARGIPLEGLADGGSQGRGTVEVQQFEQLSRLRAG